MGDVEYDDNGIPMCPNCEKNAESCECWDFEVVHAILQYRLREGLLESPYLQSNTGEEEDDDDDESEENSEEQNQ